MVSNTKVKGFVIIYVLWFLTLTGFTLMTIMSYVVIDRRKLLNVQEEYIVYTQSFAYAKVALQLYIEETDIKNKPLDSKLYSFSDEHGVYEVYVEPEDGKLSLNLTDRKTLENLFKLLAIKNADIKAREIVNTRDLENIEFRSLTQLLDFLSYEDFLKVKNHVTINFMPVNPNYADIIVLKSLGIATSEAQYIINLRKTQKIHEKDILLNEDILKKMIFNPRSYLFRLKVVNRENHSEFNFILDRGGNVVDIYE